MIDVERILLPVSVQQACGESLAFSNELDEIAQARRQDDPTLPQGEWTAAPKEADWPFVARRCEELLQTRSKDLQLSVWLVEAAALTRGFRGMGDGLAVTTALLERHWEALHPLPEDGDHEQRIGNLAWLAARLPALVKSVPVTEDGAIALQDFEAARQRNNSAHTLQQDGWPAQSAPELPDIAQLDAQRRRNSEAFNAALLDDAQYCLATLEQLEVTIDARLGPAAPGFSAARTVLRDAVDFIALLAPEPVAAQEEALPVKARASGQLQSRQDALAQLRIIAAFFRQTEPHSPVAYLAEKAAAWGDMPLHVWLHSVVKDAALAEQLNELLGVRDPAET